MSDNECFKNIKIPIPIKDEILVVKIEQQYFRAEL